MINGLGILCYQMTLQRKGLRLEGVLEESNRLTLIIQIIEIKTMVRRTQTEVYKIIKKGKDCKIEGDIIEFIAKLFTMEELMNHHNIIEMELIGYSSIGYKDK